MVRTVGLVLHPRRDAVPAIETIVEWASTITQALRGMSLRDYFAARALLHFLDVTPHSTEYHYMDRVAQYCYEMADAMLAQRTPGARRKDERPTGSQDGLPGVV